MVRDWSEILTGTSSHPGREFFNFIIEYTNYDRVGTGLPFGYTKVNAYGLSGRDSWITETQAAIMEQALQALRKQYPFAFRVFFKHWFHAMPLRLFNQNPKLCKELRVLYSWDGTLEELEYQLLKGNAFLFTELEKLTNGNKRVGNGKRNRRGSGD